MMNRFLNSTSNLYFKFTKILCDTYHTLHKLNIQMIYPSGIYPLTTTSILFKKI